MSDLIKRIISVAGEDFDSRDCRVTNPHITARESIELANYIVALQAELKSVLAQRAEEARLYVAEKAALQTETQAFKSLYSAAKSSSDKLSEMLDSAKEERDALLAQLASFSKHDSPLQHDLVVECERAMKQRDEYLRTKVSTAGHGGSHDTCFTAILRNHIKLNEQHLRDVRDVRAEAGRDAIKALIAEESTTLVVAHSGCRGTDAGDLIDVSAITVQDAERFTDKYAERVKEGE